jgi:adenylate cyclase
MGVRYVLEGSVRKTDNQVRVTAQLIDATTGGHLWAERYDRPLKDIFKEAERAIALDPNGAEGYMVLGNILGWAGRPEEGIAMAERAMRLNPRYPTSYFLTLGFTYRLAGRYEDGIATAKKALARQPNYPPLYFVLAFCYGQLDQLEEARVAGAEFQRLIPMFSLEIWKQRAPFKAPTFLERDLAALRKAGLK